MPAPISQLRVALTAFDREDRFSDADYDVLRAVLAGALSRRQAQAQADLLDGLVNLFFERHLMNDGRRHALLAMDDEALLRALRHRFRQLVADEHDDHRPYHALQGHVREVLDMLSPHDPPREIEWPASLRSGTVFVRGLVEQAVRSLWAEQGRRPTVGQASAELFARYVRPLAAADEFTGSRLVPEALSRRLDGQRLAAGILEVLSMEEKDLLRHVLTDEGSVEQWAEQRGCSRATAYRLMARLKAMCRLEFRQRSNGTQLEALHALAQGLKAAK
jgi:hypothetical protein